MYILFYNMIGVHYILPPPNAFIPFLPWSLGEKQTESTHFCFIDSERFSSTGIVCVCVREREREEKGGRGREGLPIKRDFLQFCSASFVLVSLYDICSRHYVCIILPLELLICSH